MRVTIRRTSIGFLTALAMAASLITGATSSAAAADWDRVSCNIGPLVAQMQTKYCRAIPAHRSQHWVLIDVNQIARHTEWWVTDLDTGAVVGHGTGDARNRTIYGLYGERYQLRVHGYGTNAWAANYT